MASRPPLRALLIDISGTLLVGSSPTPGAAQALARLRAAHIPFRLCSNTSKESSASVHKRMLAAGLDIRRNEVWTSVGALGAVLKELEIKRPYMLLSSSALEELTDDRIDPSTSPPSLPYDAVVVGLAPALLDYTHLNTAFRILVGEERPRDTTHSDTNSTTKVQSQSSSRPPLIALHRARYLEASDHALSLGPGPFVRALEDATGASALVVGKPTREFFETVLRDLEREFDATKYRGDDVPGVDVTLEHVPEQHQPSSAHAHRWEGVAVIGDDVLTDLGEGAIELGLWRVLVKTGKYRSGDERRVDAQPPDQISPSFSDFIETLLNEQNTHKIRGERKLI